MYFVRPDCTCVILTFRDALCSFDLIFCPDFWPTLKIAATKIATGKFGHSEPTAREHYFSTLRESAERFFKHYHFLYGETADSPVRRYAAYPEVAGVDDLMPLRHL